MMWPIQADMLGVEKYFRGYPMNFSKEYLYGNWLMWRCVVLPGGR